MQSYTIFEFKLVSVPFSISYRSNYCIKAGYM